MRIHRKEKNKLLIFICLIFIIATSIGYAILTEQLTINNTVSYDAMKWDVGFTAVEDGFETLIDDYIKMFEETEGTTLEEIGMTREDFEKQFTGGNTVAPSTGSISADKKTVTINCELEMLSESQFCYVKTTISNNSTFNIKFSETPVANYEDTYIEYFYIGWWNHNLYDNEQAIVKNQYLESGQSAEVMFVIITKELTEETLPSTAMNVPLTITFDFEESQDDISNFTMLKNAHNATEFRDSTYRSKIKTITFEDKINVPDNVVESWDISSKKNGTIISYLVPNINDSAYYDLYIQSNGKMYGNWDMYGWFSDFNNLDAIYGLELLDTSQTINMSGLFSETGYDSTIFTLDVSTLDTSNVINMDSMFSDTGYSSTVFTLDLSNFDTSNVTDMSRMFSSTGYSNPTFTLDLSSFNTSKVTDMWGMFYDTGYSSSTFTLDISHFDTSNVTNMGWMFVRTGYSSPVFTLDVSNFDTSKVTDTSHMFSNAGYNSPYFNTTITIRNHNTTSYTDMFYGVATKENSKITVNYTSETSDLVDQMIATKSDSSNVVKGVQVD